MPRKSRGVEIEGAIREYIRDAVYSDLPLTDEKLMEVAQCSRATFYKYVFDGSTIEREVEQARNRQKKNAGTNKGGSRLSDAEITIKQLREEAKNAKLGAKELAAVQVSFVANLIELGVPPAIVDKAQRDAMSKPDRRVSRAGYPRNRTAKRRGR